MPSTGKEVLLDSVKFKHRATAIPSLTPADRILEAAKQLDVAIRQQAKKAPMDKITAVELLRAVLVGEGIIKLSLNSVQKAKQKQENPHKPSIV